MVILGLTFLVVAFVAAIVAALMLLAGHFSKKTALSHVGRTAVLASAIALLVCCLVLVVCFFTGDYSILYVLEERTTSTDGMSWLYKLAGLWAGRAGSLLFWTFLIALFNSIVLARGLTFKRDNGQDAERARTLDDIAMAIVSIVVAVFAGVLLFSEGNLPFSPTPESYFNSDGSLTSAASIYSMNRLLEHWAMAIHPPMLFVGYAGLTIPFGYAMASLVVNDQSKLWVERTTRFVIASWLFLGIGIGLGAVWAYVVLGWGGYWGWDPVENASLLSWLVCVALVHTLTVYRQRGAFKRWAVMCACLAFTFVIVATFITRSGIVQSVHAFAGDPVSLALFGGLIAVSVFVPAVGLAIRWKSFDSDTQGGDEVENMLSKEAAYYFNNIIMIVFTLLLTYMTVSAALPDWMPFGGNALSTTAYEAVARPLGIVYLLILAVCPLLAWGKTDPKKFLTQARIPAICALALFVLLAIWWVTQCLPVYGSMLAQGNANSQLLYEAGPSWYYNGLAVVGLLVASLLLFNAAFMFVRNIKASGKRASAIGGSFAHVAMAVILIGLIGSNMYVYERTGYMEFDEETKTAQPFYVQEYRLDYTGDSISDDVDATNTASYTVEFDVYKNGEYVGHLSPNVEVDVMTQQQKLNAAVLSFVEEDLFVVYRGVNAYGDFSLDVRVNPFISLVWVGFGMLMLGTLFALVGRRNGKASVRSGGADGNSVQKLRSLHSVPDGASASDVDALHDRKKDER